jgi:RND family efflux transporter MFP subunit
MKFTCRLFTLALTALLLSACDKAEKEAPASAAPPPAPTIAASSLATAEMRTVHPESRVPAVIEAVQLARVISDVAGTLLANHFTAGDVVEQGQLLVEIDPSQYQAAQDAASAELLSAKANLEQAESNWKRAESLGPDGYISQLDFDKARASVGIARAAVAKAEALLQRTSLDLAHTKVYAPFGGRISKPSYAVGDFVPVTPGAPPLFELVQLDPVYATANIPLNLYNDFVLLRQELKKKGLEIPELEIHLELAGGRLYPHVGTFENWSHTSDGGSGMIEGRALMPNPEGLLLPGQNVTVVSRAAQEITRVMVPQKAVQQDQQGRYVLVVDDEDTVQRRDIELGIRDGEDWAIREGLDEGERVITQGLQMLRPGTKVSVSE